MGGRRSLISSPVFGKLPRRAPTFRIVKLSQNLVPALAVVITVVGLYWALAGGCAVPQDDAPTGPPLSPSELLPREVGVDEVLAIDLVKISEGRTLRLSGVGGNLKPEPGAEGSVGSQPELTKLSQLLVGKRFMLRPDPARPVDISELRGELWTIGPDGNARSINEELLKDGTALLDLTRGPAAGDERFRAAAMEYANPRSRRSSIPLGFQGGVVLPLYSKEENFDYGPRLQEIKDHGASWVSLLFVWIIDRMESHQLHPQRNQARKEDNRTPTDEVLIKTIKQAKDLGLRVLLFPVVLPWRPGPDDWRGNLRPANRNGFFENYGQFILRHADLAESLHVDAYSIGSELMSLEGKEDGAYPKEDTENWRRVVRSVRSRFGGRLTYSANWDHYFVLKIQDELDFIGLTAYYSLTKNDDATVDEMAEAWRPICNDLEKHANKWKRPVVFTEVGYFSIRGTNKDPWNYKISDTIDLDIQKRCYEAFAKVFGKPSFLAGAYFFDWYDNGGPKDKNYTPRGKPAAQVMKQFLEDTKKLPPPKYDPAK